VSVEVAIAAGARLGEGPRWDASRGRLLWVDIEGRALHLSDPETGADRAIQLDNRVGAAAPMSDGRVLAALADRLAALDVEDESLETLAAFPHGPRLRTNDGACDPLGRFWIGTTALDFAPGQGSLYRYDGELVPVLTEVTLSNGLGWSPDGTLMYFVDSRTSRVDVFDFDEMPVDRRPFVTIDRDDGTPDGLTVDDEGGVWLALYGGGCVRRYRSDGGLDDVLELPARHVTACCFGGAGLRQLFVTSAAPDGDVYVTEPGVTGPAAQPFHSTAPSDAEPTSRR
jgi:sugar lactone lactonase YvrE